jgi:hypothetical protein
MKIRKGEVEDTVLKKLRYIFDVEVERTPIALF